MTKAFYININAAKLLWGNLLLWAVFSISSCTVVQPYESMFLNDPAMQMSQSSNKNFENYVQSIREGATPTSGAKSSGGCGCN